MVKSLPQESDQSIISQSQEDISQAVKNAGTAVRDKAQALRAWRQTYDDETESLVTAASQSTRDVLDNISTLGLQEIGMRWAWMDGVTYKDWSKYHEVRKNFDQWTLEVEAVAKDHPGIHAAQEAGKDIESSGMAVAEDTAKELMRLKEVASWKLHAQDDTDDFSTRQMPPAAAKAKKEAVEKVQSASEQVLGTAQGSVDSLSSVASDTAAQAASSASSAINDPVQKASSKFSQASSSASKGVKAGTPAPESVVSDAFQSARSAASDAVPDSSTPLTDDVSSGVSSVSSSASSVAQKAPRKVPGGAMAQKIGEQKPILDDLVDEDATYSEKLQSMVDQAGDTYADITRAVSEAMLRPTSTQGSAESMSSLAGEQYSSALAAASSALYGTTQGTVESMTSVASDKYAEAVAA